MLYAVVRAIDNSNNGTRVSGLAPKVVYGKLFVNGNDIARYVTITELGSGDYQVAYDATTRGDASVQIDLIGDGNASLLPLTADRYRTVEIHAPQPMPVIPSAGEYGAVVQFDYVNSTLFGTNLANTTTANAYANLSVMFTTGGICRADFSRLGIGDLQRHTASLITSATPIRDQWTGCRRPFCHRPDYDGGCLCIFPGSAHPVTGQNTKTIALDASGRVKVANGTADGQVPTDAQVITALLTQAFSGANSNFTSGGSLGAVLLAGSLQVKATDLGGNNLATESNFNSLLTAINAITRNTARSMPVLGNWWVRPSGGTTTYTVDLYLYNLAGQLEDPDGQAVTISAGTSAGGTDLIGNLSATSMSRVGVGHYRTIYNLAAAHAVGQIYFAFAWTITETVNGTSTPVGGADAAVTMVQDAEQVATLAAIYAQVQKLTFDTVNNVLSSPQTPAAPRARMMLPSLPPANRAWARWRPRLPRYRRPRHFPMTIALSSKPCMGSCPPTISPIKRSWPPRSPPPCRPVATERNAIADALLDRADAIETGKTPRQVLRILAAILAGKVSGAGSGTENFVGLDGTTPRVRVSTDTAGNRLAVTFDPVS